VIVRNFSRILRGEEPIVFGDGQQVLDYVYVDDVVRAVLRATQSPTSGDVINIGTGQAVSINLLTETMLRVAQSSLRPKPGPADWTAGTWRVSNPTKTKELLGWEAEVGLEDGLRQVWLWLRESRKQHRMLS
jgi:UDP-glucose 4-epimerase